MPFTKLRVTEMGNQLSAADAVADGSYKRALHKTSNITKLVTYAVEITDWELFKNMFDILYEKHNSSRDFEVARLLSELYNRNPKKILGTVFESDYGKQMFKTILLKRKDGFPVIFRETVEDVIMDLDPEVILRIAEKYKGLKILPNSFNVFWAKHLCVKKRNRSYSPNYFAEFVEDPNNIKHMCSLSDKQYEQFSKLFTHKNYVNIQVKKLHIGTMKKFFDIRPIPDVHKIVLKDYKKAENFKNKYQHSTSVNLRTKKDFDELPLNSKKYLFSEFGCVNSSIREMLFEDEELTRSMAFLHTAVQNENYNMVDTLLRKGISITILDEHGKMAYEYAHDDISYKLYKQLAPHGARRTHMKVLMSSFSEGESDYSDMSITSSKKRVSFIDETSDTAGITSHSE